MCCAKPFWTVQNSTLFNCSWEMLMQRYLLCRERRGRMLRSHEHRWRQIAPRHQWRHKVDVRAHFSKSTCKEGTHAGMYEGFLEKDSTPRIGRLQWGLEARSHGRDDQVFARRHLNDLCDLLSPKQRRATPKMPANEKIRKPCSPKQTQLCKKWGVLTKRSSSARSVDDTRLSTSLLVTSRFGQRMSTSSMTRMEGDREIASSNFAINFISDSPWNLQNDTTNQ